MKKNKTKIIGIAVLALAIVFGMTACDTGGGDSTPPNPTPGYIGPALNFTEQVYIIVEDEEGLPRFEQFINIGSAQVSAFNHDGSPIGEYGTIIGGQLRFTIDTPEYLTDIAKIFEGFELTGLTFTPAGVLAAELDLRAGSRELERLYISGVHNAPGRSTYTMESVDYIYVASPVNMRAETTVITEGKWEDDFGNVHTWKMTVNGFNINLRAGWNSLVSIVTEVYTYGENDDFTEWSDSTSTSNAAARQVPSRVRWVIDNEEN